MKFFSLQNRIVILAALLITLPIVVLLTIFKYSEGLFKARTVITGIHNVQVQLGGVKGNMSYEEIDAMPLEEFQPQDGEELSQEALLAEKNARLSEAMKAQDIKALEAAALDDFFGTHAQDIERLDKGLLFLKRAGDILFTASMIFLPMSIVILWFYLAHSSGPVREVIAKMKLFQNEKMEESSTDILECAFQFDDFLTTARTILSESRSIALELSRKLNPLTSMAVFSDENINHFFTDVQEVSRSSSYIANTLDRTNTSIQEVSASAQTIAGRSNDAAKNSADTAAIAGDGKNAVSETIDTMESIKDEVLGLEDVIDNLNRAGKQIAEIVNTITNIAYQTNLLALNAAIEAARAGEHGHGFTVVAGEVRKLAEESSDAAEDIGKEIKSMLQKTAKAVEIINNGSKKVIQGVSIANVAGDNLDKIVDSVANVNKMIQDISAASTEQSNNINTMRGSIESISGATKITSEGTKRVASAVQEQLAQVKSYMAAAKELLTLVQLMSDMLDKFNLN